MEEQRSQRESVSLGVPEEMRILLHDMGSQWLLLSHTDPSRIFEDAGKLGRATLSCFSDVVVFSRNSGVIVGSCCVRAASIYGTAGYH